MSHLEDLLFEYYTWKGHIVRRNIKVGRLAHGGWSGELDIVTFDPRASAILHIEPSIDAIGWDRRAVKFAKKFDAGRKYLFSEVFPWLQPDTSLRQVAVLVSGQGRRLGPGIEVQSIDDLAREIRAAVSAEGRMASAAISEQFPLLRTAQMFECGYYRRL